MTASLGVWAEGPAPNGFLYRWEADQGAGGSGFVILDQVSWRFRPADRAGKPLGDIVVDVVGGEVTGSTDGVDRAVVVKVAASIRRAYQRSGVLPETAHAHFY
ncbi:hypothetical protein [Actinoplanes sp. GCM10030250]|uniref:hypothetical protein n=1 Tax=Actinoplanes sp. GCM10030250 TaxID=3273376 RepID=UPI0036171108